MFDVATRQKTDYLEHPDYNLARARFSPDGRWISFVAGNLSGAHIVVAPFRSHMRRRGTIEWISIAEHATDSTGQSSRWSPDGNLLYYTSDVDGFRCIWARRLDPTTKRAVGQPIDIYHSHSARRSLMNAGILFLELSVSRGQAVLQSGGNHRQHLDGGVEAVIRHECSRDRYAERPT